jgi:hypothetical protein
MSHYTKDRWDISMSWIPDFIISTSRIHDFSFTNSASLIHEFNFTNSTFNVMNSRFKLYEFTISTSWIHDFNITNYRFQIQGEVEIVNSWSKSRAFTLISNWFREVEIVNAWSWNRKIVQLNLFKFKSWIHENEIEI